MSRARHLDSGRQGFAVDADALDSDGAATEQNTVAPVSLIVSAFARTLDARQALTPQLVLDQGESELWLIDLGAGKARLGGSTLLQAFNRGGGLAPDLDDAARFSAFFGCDPGSANAKACCSPITTAPTAARSSR